jgi:hypothetical protein
MAIVTVTSGSVNLNIQPASGTYGPLNLTIVDVSVGLSAEYSPISLTVPGTSPIELVVETNPAVSLQLDVGQGPSGVIGTDFTTRIDDIDSLVLYRGEAVAGSSESSLVWRIQKITISGSSVSVLWSGGTNQFNKSWTDRLSYTYS